jgi:hypothetical protein
VIDESLVGKFLILSCNCISDIVCLFKYKCQTPFLGIVKMSMASIYSMGKYFVAEYSKYSQNI